MVEPRSEVVPEVAEVVDGCFLQITALELGLSGHTCLFDDVVEVGLSQQHRVGQVEMVLTDAVVASCCLLVVTVLRHAEFCDLLAVLTLVHTIIYTQL